MMRLLLVGLALLLCAGSAPAEFARADHPRNWNFPRDHGSHPNFATEWWYFTGSLQDDYGRRYGYELTFFRVALTANAADDSPWRARDLMIAHLAITDVARQRFASRERSRRLLDGIAGASVDDLALYAGDWTATRDGRNFELHAGDASLGLRLQLQPTRPVWLHGDQGLSIKDESGDEASYYVSIPRLDTTGSLLIDGKAVVVEGDTWMDHEFFSGDTPAEGLGWDWFSFHLDDGSDLMIYRVRKPGEGEYLFADLMDASGQSRALRVKDATFRGVDTWRSDATGNEYPTSWEIGLPQEGLFLRTHALLPSQEIDARRSVGFAYWEGLSEATLNWNDRSLRGSGYVELTGYSEKK